MALTRFRSDVRSSLVLLAVMQVMIVATSVGAARPLDVGGHGRALLSHGKILTDYIGASGGSIAFKDVPLNSGVQYIFPLAFAIDADASGNTANGKFSKYWSSSLTAASARAFAQAHSNVKISVSLGGASQYVSASNPSRSVDWYDPPSTDKWISNAVSSIQSLASQYSITGIDIDYENFPHGSAKFTTCIGQLITRLKNAGTISVASIAPFGSTRDIYSNLYQSYGGVIDYVNYQFYAEGLTTQSAYVKKFNNVATTFHASKLLASVNVDGSSDAGLTGSNFIGAVKKLTTYAGIMIWEADASKSNGFQMEKDAATLLTS
jgi:hypothetical protein